MCDQKIRVLNLDEREFLGEVYFNFISLLHSRYSLFRDNTRKLYVVNVYDRPNFTEVLFHREVKTLRELKSVLFNYLEEQGD